MRINHVLGMPNWRLVIKKEEENYNRIRESICKFYETFESDPVWGHPVPIEMRIFMQIPRKFFGKSKRRGDYLKKTRHILKKKGYLMNA